MAHYPFHLHLAGDSTRRTAEVRSSVLSDAPAPAGPIPIPYPVTTGRQSFTVAITS